MNRGKRAAIYPVIDGVQHRVCAKCHAPFPATFEFFHKAAGGRLFSYCKGCQIRQISASRNRRRAREATQ